MENEVVSRKGLNLLVGKPTKDRTKFLVSVANEHHDNSEMLFISLNKSKEKLYTDYQLVDDVVVIDNRIKLEDLVQYIDEYKPEYLFIDDLQLMSCDYDSEEITLYKLTELKRMQVKYDIQIIVSLLVPNEIQEYQDYVKPYFDVCKQIWALGNLIYRIK